MSPNARGFSVRFGRSAVMDYAVANTSGLAHRQVAEDLSGAVVGGCGYVAAALAHVRLRPTEPRSIAVRQRRPASHHSHDRDAQPGTHQSLYQTRSDSLRLADWEAHVGNADPRNHGRVAKYGGRVGEVVKQSNSRA